MYAHNVQIKLLGKALLLVKQNDRNTELLSAKSAILLLTVLANKQMRCQCCWRCQKHGLPFECLPVAVIVELIVGGESDEASPGSWQREEDLSGCIFPHLTEEETENQVRKPEGNTTKTEGWRKAEGVGYLCIIQLFPFWCDKIKDAVEGTREGHSSDQKDDQHHVGKRGCEVNHLSRGQRSRHGISTQEERQWLLHKSRVWLMHNIMLIPFADVFNISLSCQWTPQELRKSTF